MAYNPAVVDANDVFQVTIRQRYAEQRILNVLHIRSLEVATNGYIDWATDLANSLATQFSGAGVFASWVQNTSQEVFFEDLRVQRIWPTREVYIPSGITLNGGFDLPTPQTPNVAMSITKRTIQPGRQGVGRVQLAGWMPQSIENGLYSSDAVITAGLAWAHLSDAFTTQQGNGGPWVLYNPNLDPAFNAIVGTQANNEVRTMHRRTVRVGE